VRCIECEEIELARVRDQRAGQTLPLPYAALDGFPAGRSPSHLTRRRLMQWGVAGVASVYGAKELGWEQVWESVAMAADEPEQNALVLLYLAGGNDGLNVVLPNGNGDELATGNFDAYSNARKDIGRTYGATVSGGKVGSWALPGLTNARQLAFANPAVSTAHGGDNGDAKYGFDTLYGDGLGGAGSNLAVMPAVDATKFSLSHFDNSDIWFEASYSLTNKTGWLGRWIDEYGTPDNPLQAISIDTALSKSIRTATNPVCAISGLPVNGFKVSGANTGGSGTTDLNLAINTLAGVAAGAGNVHLDRSRKTYGLAFATQRDVNVVAKLPTDNPYGYPNTNTLSTRLRTAAALLNANLGTRVITIHWGGFDTHTNQIKSQDSQLKELSRALGAFQAELEAKGLAGKVATLVFSEFGRRVKETPNTVVTPPSNDAGTDHGAGGLMLALGKNVKGGLAAEWPGCRPADLVPSGTNPYGYNAQGNLKVMTDFRSVYQCVLQEWLGDPNGIAPALLDDSKKDPVRTLVRGDGMAGAKILFK
jgi:uncharacterized protein (DUF1501 family)